MYITKQERKNIEELDNYLNSIGLPKGFKEWVKSYEYELGLKKGNECHCIYCENYFDTNSKINDYIVCPNCKKRLLLKRYNISYLYEKQYLHVLQKYNDGYVIRQFELLQHLNFETKKIERNFIEIARQLLAKNGAIKESYIISNMYKNTGGYYYVRYYEKTTNFKPVKSSYYYNAYYDAFYGVFYPYNLDEVLKPKYYSLTNFSIKREINICDVIAAVYSNNYQFEILVKAKLYNLSLRYYEFKKGPFEKVFGVDKSYLRFMQENDINYYQLKILSKIKTKDYKFIDYLSQFESYDLDRVLKYCKPLDLYKYKLKSNNVNMYLDYLEFAKKLGFDIKDKKYLYPKHLKQMHDDYMNQIETNKNKKINKEIKKRYKELLKNQYKDKKYIIFPAASIEELVDESSQQDNCVRTYAKRIAEGECDIYFMRLLEEPKKSLVTVEVRNNKVVQQRIKNNADTTRSQKLFLKQWETKILKIS